MKTSQTSNSLTTDGTSRPSESQEGSEASPADSSTDSSSAAETSTEAPITSGRPSQTTEGDPETSVKETVSPLTTVDSADSEKPSSEAVPSSETPTDSIPVSSTARPDAEKSTLAGAGQFEAVPLGESRVNIVYKEQGRSLGVLRRRRYSTVEIAYHEVLIKRVLKGDEEVREVTGALPDSKRSLRMVRTRLYSHGVQFKKDGVYVVAGNVVNGMLWTSTAFWQEEWNKLTEDQVDGLRHAYAKNCECKIKTCWRNCEKLAEKTNKFCVWQLRFPIKNDCSVKHRVCSLEEDGSCLWKHGNGYDNCKTGVSP